MEEVESNHIPEFIKDIVVEHLVDRRYQWIELFYQILQEESSVSLSFHAHS